MALAYTNKPCTYVQIAATPALAFLATLKTTLLGVGWQWVSAYDNGDLYQIQSPQGLKVRVRIWYPNAAPYVDCFALQLQSANFPSTVGYVHHFIAGYSAAPVAAQFTHYAVWANCCSLFIGAVHANPAYGALIRAVHCGVPFTVLATEPTPECAEQRATAPLTNELWWSAGDDTGTGLDIGSGPPPAADFRNSYFCQRYSLMHNTTDMSATAGTPYPNVESQLLQLCVMKANYYWNALGGLWSAGFIRPDNSPLAYDPMLASQGYIFGQLYDACLLTKPMALEAAEDIHETTPTDVLTHWRNYTLSRAIFISTFKARDEGRCYSLLLLTAQPEVDTEELNVAY